MDKHKAELMSQLRVMNTYLDEHYEDITEKDALSAMTFINGAWRFLERRKGERRA